MLPRFCTLLCIGILFSTASSKSSAAQTDSTAPKWEYKIVEVPATLGTTLPESPAGSEPRWVDLKQPTLNKLGVRGWELVLAFVESETTFPNFAQKDTVLGLKPNVRSSRAVLLFKRTWNPGRTEREDHEDAEAEIRSLEEAKRAREAYGQDPSELVDLDKLDSIVAAASKGKADAARLSTALSSSQKYKFISIETNAPNDYALLSRVMGRVVYDGTLRLLKDGNKYRASEAQSLAKEIAWALYKQIRLHPTSESNDDRDVSLGLGHIRILVEIDIAFGKGMKEVSQFQVSGDW